MDALGWRCAFCRGERKPLSPRSPICRCTDVSSRHQAVEVERQRAAIASDETDQVHHFIGFLFPRTAGVLQALRGLDFGESQTKFCSKRLVALYRTSGAPSGAEALAGKTRGCRIPAWACRRNRPFMLAGRCGAGPGQAVSSRVSWRIPELT